MGIISFSLISAQFCFVLGFGVFFSGVFFFFLLGGGWTGTENQSFQKRGIQNTVRFVGQAGGPVDLLFLLKSGWLLEVSHSARQSSRNLRQPGKTRPDARLTTAGWPRPSRQRRSQERLRRGTYRKLLGDHRTRPGPLPHTCEVPRWAGPEPRSDSWMFVVVFFLFALFTFKNCVSGRSRHLPGPVPR